MGAFLPRQAGGLRLLENRNLNWPTTQLALERMPGLDVYTTLDIRTQGVVNVAVAKVFQSGNSQAVRLPKEFRLAAKEVEIFRRGDEIVLREPQRGLLRALDILNQLPDDFMEDRYNPPPQEREDL
jgi:antitoxin VapB